MSVHGTTWAAMGSDIGRRRHNNEDFVLACEPSDEALRSTKGHLYIVADGIGGGAAGEIASRFSALAVAHHYYLISGDPTSALRHAIAEANSTLYDYAQSHPRLSTMGTTIVAAAIWGSVLHVAHVGDSRAYLVREGSIHRLTEDHSLANRLARDGIITAAQAERHPQRHLLLRSIGGERQALPDFRQIPLRADDSLLLCSDGLTRHISDSELANAVATSDPVQAVAALLEQANHRGGHDNISALIVRWGCEMSTPVPRDGILVNPPPSPDIDEIRLAAQTQKVSGPNVWTQQARTSQQD
jgi:serine/threonine protein phosphatase PrpC